MKIFIIIFLVFSTLSAAPFKPDVEIKVKGLVCSACGIGIKKFFKKYRFEVKDVKIDIHNQLVLVDLAESKNKRIYWIKNQEIIKLVKEAGYEVSYIKRLHSLKPSRYNKP